MLALITTLVCLAGPNLSVRVDGPGYLRFVREGRIVYANHAALVVAGGLLTEEHGLAVTPAIRIPASTHALTVDLDGTIHADSQTVGRLVLATFEGPLRPDGAVFIATSRAKLANPGEGLAGVIRTAGQPVVMTAAPPTGIVIHVHGLTEVESAEVKLGDIADISGSPVLANEIFATAPPIGIDLPVSQFRLKAICKKLGIEAELQIPAGAVIRRKCQEVPDAQFVAAAQKACADEAKGLPLVATGEQPPFKAPLGQVELRSEAVTHSGVNYVATIGLYVDGKRVNSRVISLKPDASAQIKPGAQVKVIMKSAGLSVEIPARARSGGVVGQAITVVTDTGAVLTGIVLDAGRVEVKL